MWSSSAAAHQAVSLSPLALTIFLGLTTWEYFLFIGSFTVNHTGCAGYQVKSAEYNSYNSYNSLNFVYFSDCISSFIRTLHGTWKQVWKN